MKELLLHTHYGFGDYVICYGMIKELAKEQDLVTLFVQPHRSKLHIDNVRRLYSSIKKVQITENPPEFCDGVVYVGEGFNPEDNIQFPKFFYQQMKVPLGLMWQNFYFKSDIKKEKEIYYDILGLKDNEEYIFLHDDPVRDFIIDRKHINPNIKIIHLVELEDISILDTLYLVEKSKEVHMYTTGLASFVDQMSIKHNNLNLHLYVRSTPTDQPILLLDWNIIEKKHE